MTPEQKQLLLKDLCARLPYKVKCSITKKGVVRELKPMNNGISMPVNQVCDITLTKTLTTDIINDFVNDNVVLKPYLRPMSSMTEEEEVLFRCELPAIAKTDAQLVAMRMELFLKGHLDFNHLIEKGLALEAPEDMYKN